MMLNTFIAQSMNYQSKLDIISALYHQWDIKELRESQAITGYLLNWSPVYFLNNLKTVDGNNILTKDDKDYEISFFGNQTIDDLNKASKVAISFRECKELGLQIALVKFIWTKGV